MKQRGWKQWIAGSMAVVVMTGTVCSDCRFVSAGTTGKSDYTNAFDSLYEDVITNGKTNGYLSDKKNSDTAYGVPYHAVETFVVDGVDYGHETTSEDVSYLVQAAAMHDVLSAGGKLDGQGGELDKAWTTLESMIPGWSTVSKEEVDYQKIWSVDSFQADIVAEGDAPYDYPIKSYSSDIPRTTNPLWSKFKQNYSNDKGYYLMQSLADVDDWYGFGGRKISTEQTGNFTFIRTQRRGEAESVFEAVPHPCVERLQYGNDKDGMLGIFVGSNSPEQYIFANAPAAEQRAVTSVYLANRYGANNAVSKKAGKMGDELRNVMHDTYYKPIGIQDIHGTVVSQDEKSRTYLIGHDTAWGAGLSGQYTWAWQTGGSHICLSDQNPLAAYALLKDEEIGNGMLTSEAKEYYQESLKRQIEFCMWLQSKNGPFAGGCTNNYRGRYETYTSGMPCFYNMVYVAHPAHVDPGSNESIRSQAMIVQRLAELYLDVKQYGEIEGIQPGKKSMQDGLDTLLDRWISWFIENVNFDQKDEFGNTCAYSVPLTLDWGLEYNNQPDYWSGKYDPNGNQNLKAEIKSYGQADVESVSAICNALIYYAKAKGVESEYAQKEGDETAQKALYYANRLLGAQYRDGRDEIGLSFVQSGAQLTRVFEEGVYIPYKYTGKMPDGSELKNGATFRSIRGQYSKDQGYLEAEAYYNGKNMNGFSVLDNNKDGKIDLSDYSFNQHKFAAQCSAMTAYGTMALLYDEVSFCDNSYTVTFDLGGKGEKTEVTVQEGMTVQKPQNPTAEGFVFDGWYTSSDCKEDEKYDFTRPVEGELTLYAKWTENSETPGDTADVIFDLNGKGESSTVTVEKGKPVSQPQNPTAEGFVFDGWYTSADCKDGEKYDFTKTVENSFTLYAKWSEKSVTPPGKKTYTVFFNLNGKGDGALQEIVEGNCVAEPEKPTAEGFTFEGWYLTSDCKESARYDFTRPVESALILYAKWIKTGENDSKTEPAKESENAEKRPAAKGSILEDSATNAVYVVTSVLNEKPTVEFCKSTLDSKNVEIPATIEKNGVTYLVTSVADNACKGKKALTKLTIGPNVEVIGANAFKNCGALTKVVIPASVRKIGKNAFNGCKKLKSIIIKTTKLKKSSVGANAFKGIHAKAKAKVPKKNLKAYTKILRARGMKSKKQKITK